MVVEPLYPMFDMIFLPITGLPHYVSILIISTMLTLIVLSLNKLLVKKHIVKEIKTKMEEIKENLNKAQKEGNKETVNKLVNEMMKTNNEYMKHTFRSLIVSMVVVSLFLPWVGAKYQGLTVATLPFTLPFVGNSLEWLYWYILVSITAGLVLNRLFGVTE